MMYLVQARARWTVTDKRGTTWSTSAGVPTFFLDASFQGLVGLRHATSCAAHMLRDLAPEKHFSIVVADENHEVYVYDTENDGGL
jgi:hypothetical protein